MNYATRLLVLILILPLAYIGSFAGCASTSFSDTWLVPLQQERAQAMHKLDNADSLKDFLEVQRDNRKLGPESIDINYISEKRRQWYVDNRNDLSVEMKEIVLSGKWRIGMTRNDLYASIGIPEDINRSVYTFGVHEQWIYDYDIRVPRTTTVYFYFEDGILTSWQD